MDVVEWFNKFGPMGAMFLFLISAIIYHTKWLRAWQEDSVKQQTEERIRIDNRNDEIRRDFLNTIREQQANYSISAKEQQNNFNYSMEKVVAEFRSAMKEMKDEVVDRHETVINKVDGVEGKVDQVKDGVQELLARHR